MAADTGMDTCPSPEITDSRKRPLDGDSENGDIKRSHFSSVQDLVTALPLANGHGNITSHFAVEPTYHFKVLVPSMVAGAIIGKGGETIAQLQKDTGARVKMSKSHDFYPGDFSGTDSGDEYRPDPRARSSSSSSSRSSSSSSSSGNSSSSSRDIPSENNNSNNESLFNGHNQPEQPTTKPRGKKRTRNPTTWKKNVAKRLKNSGQTYISVNTKKLNQSKTMGPSCTSKCRLSCAAKFTEQKRTEIFKPHKD